MKILEKLLAHWTARERKYMEYAEASSLPKVRAAWRAKAEAVNLCITDLELQMRDVRDAMNKAKRKKAAK